jgi:excinuclease ABC subunit C
VDDRARYFGPFASSGALRRTLNLVRHTFNLRGCRPLHPGEADYRHCLYAHLKVCTAPCIGNVSREQYLMQVRAACDFLEGQCSDMAAQLEHQMRQAAAALDFEKAAEIRDLLADIRHTTEKTRAFPRLPYTLPVAIHPEADLQELARCLQLPAPPTIIDGFDISNISGTFAVASVVRFHQGRPDRNAYRRFKIRTVTGQDDFACMAEAVSRRYRRLIQERQTPTSKSVAPSAETQNPPALPDLIVIDGGKGQLNAARTELKQLGLDQVPAIGLAKEFEEIHCPGEREPLRLDPDSGALKLLQRVRDESHRFANTYNAQLRLRRISESMLDEFPGIGQQRKAALLKRFGSVPRLRRATVEELATVPGFGPRLAAELKAFLEARTGSPPLQTPPPPPESNAPEDHSSGAPGTP